jgi:hypothetical protein
MLKSRDPASLRWVFLYDRPMIKTRRGEVIPVLTNHRRKNVMVAEIAFVRETDDDALTTSFNLFKWNRLTSFQESAEWAWLQEIAPSAEFVTGFTTNGSLVIRDQKDVAKLLLMFGPHDDPERYWSQ